jgi:rSAM/selenodomain-associated transferase 2
VKLSVVIPALDEAERIETAIRGAFDAPHEPVDVEVIVVDGGSADATPELAAAAGARVVSGPRGRAWQLAAGVRASAGDVVLMLHADTRLPHGWRADVCEALRDERVVGGAFRFRFDEQSPALRFIELGARLRSGWLRLPYGDQALFVRRCTLDAIGGIPEVPLMEDLDLVQRMKRAGRLALLSAPAVTSARRYRAGGPLRTMLRHWLATAAWTLGVERARIARWVGRPAQDSTPVDVAANGRWARR